MDTDEATFEVMIQVSHAWEEVTYKVENRSSLPDDGFCLLEDSHTHRVVEAGE